MRGIPHHNFDEFHRISGLLHDRGYDVLNPMDSRFGAFGGARAEYLREDATMLMIADAVVVMSGWKSSPGARVEVALAWSFEIPVFLFADYKSDWHLVKLDKEVQVSIPSELNKAPLLGLCGYAHSGKDAFASYLCETGEWTRVAFADPIKDVAYAIGWNGEKDDEGRVLLQDLGVGIRKNLFEDVWVTKAEETIDRLKTSVVVTDARFPNEIEMIRRRGGRLIWMDRPGVGPINGHISEHAVKPEDTDAVFDNDGTLADMDAALGDFVTDVLA